MRLNQVTITLPDLEAGWRFYAGLGLAPIVDARPDYARFACPDGDSTFSLHRGEARGSGATVYFECEDLDQRVSRLKQAGYRFASDPTDRPWLWREAELFYPGGTASFSTGRVRTASIRHGVCKDMSIQRRIKRDGRRRRLAVNDEPVATPVDTACRHSLSTHP